MELRSQISHSGVQVDVDAPKGQDLAQIMEDMRANYEKIAGKNAEDLKRWHENQVIQRLKSHHKKIIFWPEYVMFFNLSYRLQMCRCRYLRTQKLFRAPRWRRVTYPDRYRH